jgi:hypothetical protein
VVAILKERSRAKLQSFQVGFANGCVVCSIQNHNHLHAIQITIGEETLYFILHTTNPKT